MGSIFQMDNFIYLCGPDGLRVKVPTAIYHQKMYQWTQDRMPHPLVFIDGRVRCTMTAKGSEVELELSTIDEEMNVLVKRVGTITDT